MRLPLHISVPHAGTRVPPEVQGLCVLNRKDLLAGSDVGADAIFFPLQDHAAGFSATDVARSLVDLNRAPDDIGGNGVIKNHTCWNIPVYSIFPNGKLIRDLLERYYIPYHEKLSAGAAMRSIKLGIDCHTMSAVGPPVGPDPGRKRPLVCVSNAEGTCPDAWIKKLALSFASVFGEDVAINTPFRGGYITRSHADEMYWIQVEISQTGAYSNEFKRDCVLAGLQSFCHSVLQN